MTRMVPAARESGMLRCGCFTSPAVKVMLFQASAEKSEPTWATQNAMKSPKAPVEAITAGKEERSGLIVSTPCGVQKSEKLALMASAFRPMNRPMKMRAIKDRVLAEVKTF